MSILRNSSPVSSPAFITGGSVLDFDLDFEDLYFEEKGGFLHKYVRTKKHTLILCAGAAFFTFVLSLSLFSLPSQNAVAGSAVAPLQASYSTLGASAPPLEMHIANNGLMLLRGARVVAMSGTTLTVSTVLGSVDFKWVVHTNASSYEKHDFGTRFINPSGQKISLQDIHPGDLVTITGMIGGTAEQPTLEADSVRSFGA